MVACSFPIEEKTWVEKESAASETMPRLLRYPSSHYQVKLHRKYTARRSHTFKRQNRKQRLTNINKTSKHEGRSRHRYRLPMHTHGRTDLREGLLRLLFPACLGRNSLVLHQVHYLGLGSEPFKYILPYMVSTQETMRSRQVWLRLNVTMVDTFMSKSDDGLPSVDVPDTFFRQLRQISRAQG